MLKTELEELTAQQTREIATLKASLESTRAVTEEQYAGRLAAADSESERLRAELARTRAERDVYHAAVQKQQRQQKRLDSNSPASCINCGQEHDTIIPLDAERFQCPACDHIWALADELSPFRNRSAI